jgi:hypothetical protein
VRRFAGPVRDLLNQRACKAARKCQQSRLAVNKVTFVLKIAARLRSAKVGELIAEGTSWTYYYRLSVPTILEVPSGNSKYVDGKFNGLAPAPDETDNFSVVRQFTEKWEHPSQVPTVIKVRLFRTVS